ncbi:hypothetical protein GYH30_010213 [Glycine max]|nr:hypothetical protein GYH30_010213 [Glycine max]
MLNWFGAYSIFRLGKRGGRVLYPRCNVRYELYPFYHVTASPPSPSPSPPTLLPPSTSPISPGSSGISAGTIVPIVVPITIVVLIFIVRICFLSRRARKKQQDSVKEGQTAYDITTMDSLQFDFSIIEAATTQVLCG